MISLSFGYRPESHSLSLTLATQWPFSQVAINEWPFLIDDNFTLASALGVSHVLVFATVSGHTFRAV